MPAPAAAAADAELLLRAELLLLLDDSALMRIAPAAATTSADCRRCRVLVRSALRALVPLAVGSSAAREAFLINPRGTPSLIEILGQFSYQK